MLMYEQLKRRTPFETLIYELPADCKKPTLSLVSYRIGKVRFSEAAEDRVMDTRVWVRQHYCAAYVYGRINYGLSNESFAYYSALDRNAWFR